MPSYAFLKGEFVPLEEARIGVMTHALHYGTAVFEGIRGNWNEQAGRCIFSAWQITTSGC
jgi:branched-chain amino acid aminotransferase